jgi:hypothetical protein
MIPKVESCVNAVRNEVRRAHILDGRIAHVLLLEIFTDEGIGTMVNELTHVRRRRRRRSARSCRSSHPGDVRPRRHELWDSDGKRYLDFLGGLA